MISIIHNSSGEIRHLWKFLFSILVIVLIMLITEIVVFNAKIRTEIFNPFYSGLLLGSVFCLKVVYKAELSRLGLRLSSKSLILFFAGMLIPFIIKAQFILIDRFIFRHNYSLSIPGFTIPLLYSFITFVVVAAAEELYFRVYLIGFFKNKFNLIYVFIFSSVTFSLIHSIGNPSFNQNIFIALLLSGIIYGLLYLLSNSFYLVLSAHAFHNTFQLYPVNDINTNVYLLNQVFVVFYILIFAYYYKDSLTSRTA